MSDQRGERGRLETGCRPMAVRLVSAHREAGMAVDCRLPFAVAILWRIGVLRPPLRAALLRPSCCLVRSQPDL